MTNPRAIRITTLSGLLLGYVPDPLLDYVHSTHESATDVTVMRANPADTHPHLRLLLRLSGHCTRFVFDEPEWSPLTG
nr:MULTISPECIES: hypothetical protein [unclassified Rhodococcus (in: high G+C Gram-positive bacteria)]